MRIRIRNASTSKVLIFDEKTENLDSLTLKIVRKLNEDENRTYSLMLLDSGQQQPSKCQLEDIQEIMQDDWIDLVYNEDRLEMPVELPPKRQKVDDCNDDQIIKVTGRQLLS